MIEEKNEVPQASQSQVSEEWGETLPYYLAGELLKMSGTFLKRVRLAWW